MDHANVQAWCGIDVSKATFDASVVTDEETLDISKLPVKKFTRDKQGVGSLIIWLEKRLAKSKIDLTEVGIVMEATGNYSKDLAMLLIQCQSWYRVTIVNPRQAKAFSTSLGLRNKTDQVDARALSFFGRLRKPASFKPLSAAYSRLRELTRYRRSLVNDRTAQKCRLMECRDPLVKECLSKVLKQLEALITKVEKKIKSLVTKDTQLSRDAARLRSIPGVGFTTAFVVMGELGDLRRFQTSKQISAMVGLSPRITESGTSVIRRTTISRDGNSTVRSALYMAALAGTRCQNSTLAAFYHRLVDAGKAKKSALCAAMRKMLVLMRALLVKGEYYRDNPQQPVENLRKIHPKLRIEPRK